MSEREQLEQAMAQIEAQRAILGDAVVDAAITGLRQQLSALPDAQQKPPSTMEGERRLVTVIFADISGFTAMSERLDPEQARDIVNACFERLVPVITKYGGTVSQFRGDAVMALFGAPVAHEDDPHRALCTSLEMMEALDAFNAEQHTDLGMHIGVNTGLAIAGGLGSSRYHEYSVTGDAVNVAARLEDASERGEILVGPETYRATAPLFKFQPLTPIRVKGKTDPVPVYQLLGARFKPGQARGMETREVSSSMVGRDKELTFLFNCVEQLEKGDGGIVFVKGEAGMGKSRLLAELRAQVTGGQATTNSPPQWLEGRALSFGQTISYWPFQEILRNHVGINEEDNEHTAWLKLGQRVVSLFPTRVAEVLPYLASLLALEVRGELAERVKYLDGEGMRRQIFLTMRRLVERLAKERPLILVFEDLQWSDQSSLELLGHLFPLVERAPVLICAVCRPFGHTPTARLWETAMRDHADRCTEINLLPLSPTDSAKLVHSLLGIKDLPIRWREMVLKKAEGNPFFIEEVLRSWIDMGAVVRDTATGRWRATAQLQQATIPNTIQGVVMARVDRLERQVKQVLQMASVIGRSFLYRVLYAIAAADREIDGHLSELEQLELIHEKRRIPELEYIFKHALAQETVYESILVQRRQELHAQVGKCIESLFADRLEEFYGLLAYHYARAELWEKAQEFLFKAGDQAGHVAADAEALAHYRQALTAYSRAFGDRWDPLQRAGLERKMGEALFRQGNHQQAVEYLLRASTLLGSPFPTTRAGTRLAIVRELVRQVAHRLLPGLFLKKADGTPADPIVEERAKIFEVMGWIDFFMDQERLLLDSMVALNICERHGLDTGIVTGATGLAVICDVIGLFRIAEHYDDQAVAAAVRSQHPPAIGNAYMGVGLHGLYSGQWDEATVVELERAGDAYRKTGDLRERGLIASLLRQLYLWRGDLSRSMELCQELIQTGEDGSDSMLWAWGLQGAGTVWERTGPLDEAVASLERAIDLHGSIPNYVEQVEAMGVLGQCYLRLGKLDEAVAIVEEAERLKAEQEAREIIVNSPRITQAEAYMAKAEQAEGPEKIAWMKKAERTCKALVKESNAFHIGLPATARLQGRYEWLNGKPKAAGKWWQRGLAAAEELGARYELGMIHLEMGHRLEEGEHLEQAISIFEETGAVLDLERARELMGA